MNKILIIGIILLVLITATTFLKICEDKKVNSINVKTEKVYVGAVPEGYDLNHFRETGETRKLIK